MVRIHFYDPDTEEHPIEKRERAGKPSESAANLLARGSGIDWVGQLGWRENPFTPFPVRPAQQYFVGHDAARKSISDFLARGEHLAVITGVLGIGKTMFLAWIAEELTQREREYRVVTLTAMDSVAAATLALVKPYKGVFSGYSGETNEELAEYLTKKEKKRLVICLDDADQLGTLEPLLKALLDSSRISIIIACERIPSLSLDAVLIPLSSLAPLHAQLILENRIRGVGGRGFEPFTSRAIADLWKAAQGDPTRFLKYAEETAMRVSTGQLNLNEKDEDAPEPVTPAKKGKGGKGKDEKELARSRKPSEFLFDNEGKNAEESASQEDSKRRTDLDELIEGLVDTKK